MTDDPADIEPPDDYSEEADPQIWHEYSLGCMISTMWLSFDTTPAHVTALDDGWDTLVVLPEWRTWSETYLVPAFPHLDLTVREDLEKRLLRKTKTGVSMHVPASEMFAADKAGTLPRFYAEIIHTVYEKWARGTGNPPPPPLPPLP